MIFVINKVTIIENRKRFNHDHLGKEIEILFKPLLIEIKNNLF